MIKILNYIGSHIDHYSTHILNTNLHRNKQQKKNQITFDNGQVGNDKHNKCIYITIDPQMCIDNVTAYNT